MDRIERASQKVEELFHQSAAGADGTDGEFMQILQRYIFGELCYTGSLDNRMRELVTITVLTAIQALPQLKAHLNACLNVGCTPVELREAIYQCAPFIGFPRTLNAIGEKFKMEYLTSLIIGRSSATAKSYGHTKLKWFGQGKDQNEKFWGAVIRQGLILGLINKNIENYGLLSVSPKGFEYLKKPFRVQVTLDHDYDSEDSEHETAMPSGKGSGAADEQLFAMLKDLRKKVAKEHNLPPFVIFQDPSLEDMAIHYPITIDEMTSITGVGAGKAKKFGGEFIKLIKAYVEENEIERPHDMVVKGIANKSANKVFIIQSIDRKLDFEDIAHAKDLEFNELLTEIEAIVNSGTKLNINYYIEKAIDEDKAEDIYLYFKEDAETDSLDDAMQELGADYTEEEVRLVRIKFICEQGN